MRRTLASVVLIAALLVAMAQSSVLAQGSPSTAYGVTPAPGSMTDPASSYFVIEADGGAQIRQTVRITNRSDAVVELMVAAVDASTASNGGVSYSRAGVAPQRAGALIDLPQALVTVAPGASVDVPFTVAVPADARSGLHLAGISVQEVADATAAPGSTDGGAGAAIEVQTRRVTAVQVNVPGPADPELVINGVSPVARGDGLYLEVQIANTGRGLTRGEGRLTLPGRGFEAPITFGTFVPDTSISYALKWTTDAEDGTHPARVEITYGDGKVAVWEGTFTVGDDVRDDQANRQVESAAPATTSSDGVPVAVLVAAVLATLLVASLIFWLILRRQARQRNT